MVRNKKNGSEVAQPSSLVGFPKTDVRYWQRTIFQRTYRKAGQKGQVQHYSARVQLNGRREFFALERQGLNRASAAEGAREIYLFLLANGWEATLAKYKPPPSNTGKSAVTVGDLVREVRATSRLKSLSSRQSPNWTMKNLRYFSSHQWQACAEMRSISCPGQPSIGTAPLCVLRLRTISRRNLRIRSGK